MSTTAKNQKNSKPRAQLTPEERQRMAAKNKIKRIRRKRFVIFSFSFIIIAIIVGIVYAFFAIFKITDYTVAGNKTYSNEQVFESSGLLLEKNLFLSKTKIAEEQIATELPYIDNAQISRILPGTLKYTIVETKAVSAMEYGTGIVLLNKDGKSLEQKNETKSNKLMLLRCPKPVNTETGHIIEFAKTFKIKVVQANKKIKYVDNQVDMLQVYKDLISAIEVSKIKGITVIDMKNPFDVSMVYQDRITLHIGTPTELEGRLAAAASIIKIEDNESKSLKGTINLTILEEAYFRKITKN